MRTFELVLIIANMLGLAAPWLARRWPATRHLRVAGPILAAAQIAIEGERWQLYPAYAVAAGLLAAWVWALFRARTRGPAWRSIAGAGGGLLPVALSAAAATIVPVFSFPAPTGPYAVGTTTYYWTDSRRPEVFSTEPGARRELVAQIYYPAEPGSSAPMAHYVEGTGVPRAIAALFHLPASALDYLAYVRTNARIEPPATAGPHPVLIYLTGLGGFRGISTFQVEELASQGYVVVALDQPGASALVQLSDEAAIVGPGRDLFALVNQSGMFPTAAAPAWNGHEFPQGIIPYFAEDVSSALDQLDALNGSDPHDLLTGRLDLARVGLFGVSLGGIVTGQACHDEPRIKACLVMDAFMPADAVRDGLKQPTMWLTRTADLMRLERERAGGWTERDIIEHQTTMHAVFEKLAGPGYFLNIDGIFHVNFTDVAIWSPLVKWLGLVGPIDPYRAHRLIDAYSVAFFDRHLLGRPAPLLDGPSPQYPEVDLEARLPVL